MTLRLYGTSKFLNCKSFRMYFSVCFPYWRFLCSYIIIHVFILDLCMLWLPGLWVHSRLVKCYHKVFCCVFRLFIWLLFGFIFQYPICILSLLLLFDYLSSLASSFKYPIYIFIVVVLVLVPLISQLISSKCFVLKVSKLQGYQTL